MDYVKQWTYCVCITILCAVIFSFLKPDGVMGKFYKVIVSIFLFASFFIPFHSMNNFDFKLQLPETLVAAQDNSSQINAVSNMVSQNIKSQLSLSGIENSDVNVTVNINKNNEIEIEKIIVAISQDYDKEKVKQIIYDNLSLNVSVVYVGE